MRISRDSIRKAYDSLRSSRWFNNSLTFLGFVVLAAIFWAVMALNDNVRENIEVRLNIGNVPDTVTFITLPPEEIHVTVQDKGTSLMRTALLQKPTVTLNFRDFADDGIFHVTRAELQGVLKNLFGQNSVIAAASIDSLSLTYTTSKGKRVPVVVNVDATAVSGRAITDYPKPDPTYVMVYSSGNIMDTVTRVYTQHLVKRNLNEPTKFSARISPIPGVRIIPDIVEVSIPVEPLVKKQMQVAVKTDNVPENHQLLLFPQRARIVYYVPMSRFNDSDPGFEVRADYLDIARTGSEERIPLRIEKVPDYIRNFELIDKAVEYTIVTE